MPCFCSGSNEPQRSPVVSGPLHLLLQKEGVGQAHAFRNKSFRKPRPCHWCHQPVRNQGSCCRVCKYVCHKACENKVFESVESRDSPIRSAPALTKPSQDAARFTDTSWQIHRTWRDDKGPLPLSPAPARAQPAALTVRNDHNVIYDTITPRTTSAPATPRAAPGILKDQHNGSRSLSVPSGGRDGGRDAGAGLDLCYVAERMLALHLPLRDTHAEAQAAHMLSNKHGEHFMIFEVSGSGDAARAVFGRARSLGWPPGALAPPLERLCAACKHIETWLADDHKNVAVLLAWGSRERLGVVVAAYMHYSAICGAAEHALDRYAMRRYLAERLPAFQLPSDKRYIDTFAGLLAGQIRVNAAPLHLTHVTVSPAPRPAPPAPALAFIKIYENFVCVYTSGVYLVSGGPWTVGVGRVPLRGDVLLRAYWRRERAGPGHAGHTGLAGHTGHERRQLAFACQFHSCAVSGRHLALPADQLNHYTHDPLFPAVGSVELVFSRDGGAAEGAGSAAASVPLRAAPDALARHDSLDNLRPLSTITDDDNPGENGGGSGSGSSGGGEGGEGAAHTFGPLDGSIYARVVRGAGGGPSSPLSASMDSGISSAGRRAAPSPPDELDALLGDMLRTVSALPDPPRHSSADAQTDIPYHARTDSAPFTYGVTGLKPGMLRTTNRLASPELVRRALGGDRSCRLSEDDDSPPPRRLSPQKHTLSPRTLRKITHEDTTADNKPATPPPNTNGSKWLNGDSEWSRSTLNTPKYPERNGTWRSHSTLGWSEARREPRRSESSAESTSGLTWLQRQQQRLRERREARERVARLPLEWDAPARHVRRSASHRVDGYTSDTTAFADDDDDFSVPLHVNTRSTLRASTLSPQAPDRTSSRKFMFSEQKMSSREWGGDSTPGGGAPPGLLSLADCANTDLISCRSESWSRSESRAGTPAFPTHPRTPYPPTPTPTPSLAPPTPSLARHAYTHTMLNSSVGDRDGSPESEYRSVTLYSAGSRRGSTGAAAQRVRDTSHLWFKPNISRDDAIAALQPMCDGSFIVRESNSFPGAFGLAVRVRGAGAGAGAGAGGGAEGVRHFLVESARGGVRLRGCPDEPVFGSLSALVYQHMETPLALPTALVLPDRDPWAGGGAGAAARALLAAGAACSVLLLGAHNTEALTGPAAVRRAVAHVLQRKAPAHLVHFKVFGGGITLTDAARKLFFRRHYPAAGVSYAGLDPDERWYKHVEKGIPNDKRIFAFVARASSGGDNQCHVFAELESEQPATAIVNFINKALLSNSQKRDIV